MIHLATIASPVGPLTLAARDARVCAVRFGAIADMSTAFARAYPGEPVMPDANPCGAAAALDAYFSGDLTALDDLPIELIGTPFQRRVWERLRSVRAGTTASYAEIARAIGAPTAVRAVGAANGANPIALIVPCHRIVGSNGTLTGYGGGLDRKRWLLTHESGGLFREPALAARRADASRDAPANRNPLR